VGAGEGTFRFELPNGCRLRPLEESDAEALARLVAANRDYLARWLVDWANRATSIGYWIAESSQGRGTVTEAVRALTKHAFEVWKLNRVEIRAATGNTRSAAIPLRLGYVQEGVLRQVERHGETYEDLAVYSMLATDWKP
jgi:RimJ/RimL family protein N-acetyltransferase